MKDKKSKIGIFFLLANILYFAHISACTCALSDDSLPASEQVQKAFKEATAVFRGTVKSADVVYYEKESRRWAERRVIFQVHESWKLAKDEIVVWTGTGGGDCGFTFKLNTEYVVYAHGDPKKLGTDICTRTGIFNQSQSELEFLGKPIWAQKRKK